MKNTIYYEPRTRVKIKETGLEGDVIEKTGTVVMVQLDIIRGRSFFTPEEIQFL